MCCRSHKIRLCDLLYSAILGLSIQLVSSYRFHHQARRHTAMHFSTVKMISLIFSVVASMLVQADPQPKVRQLLLEQQPLLLPEDLAETVNAHTITTTGVYTIQSYYVVKTKTSTQYIEADGSTAVPAAVQTWYGGQKKAECDRTACASCRAWYRCRKPEDTWSVADLINIQMV